ncbi:uncharacterized protein B0H18DRAFT_1138607 [Fomitopsis serialis]|uniref:uncharacterized protein n=1 Tax=Fomitopsis serialis TaxID=139415 RepID=UPI002008BCA4|nr:uncharacterized protein B0H18DRAFT_1138607 [Neoantrodia serialis]KAH9916524.1 hypothetical protein B0H18DRAFT_1138607 [Neoantrodia serialis]
MTGVTQLTFAFWAPSTCGTSRPSGSGGSLSTVPRKFRGVNSKDPIPRELPCSLGLICDGETGTNRLALPRLDHRMYATSLGWLCDLWTGMSADTEPHPTAYVLQLRRKAAIIMNCALVRRPSHAVGLERDRTPGFRSRCGHTCLYRDHSQSLGVRRIRSGDRYAWTSGPQLGHFILGSSSEHVGPICYLDFTILNSSQGIHNHMGLSGRNGQRDLSPGLSRDHAVTRLDLPACVGPKNQPRAGGASTTSVGRRSPSEPGYEAIENGVDCLREDDAAVRDRNATTQLCGLRRSLRDTTSAAWRYVKGGVQLMIDQAIAAVPPARDRGAALSSVVSRDPP